MAESILNIAGGKIPPLAIDKPAFLVNVDTMYYTHIDAEKVERKWKNWSRTQNSEFNIKSDVVEFMERTIMTFDRVCIYRFLEHVSFTNVLYFIYLLSTITHKGSSIDVIVPNYGILANMILHENPMDPAGINFEQHNIELTTELLNEPSCPHASIWTDARAEYFFTLEKRFEMIDVCNHFDFDGRNIYLRFWVRRK
jgi:hypothetical protein